MTTRHLAKQYADRNSNDPMEYGKWFEWGGKRIFYEGVAFIHGHDRALQVAEQCRQLGARCTVRNHGYRDVLLMPEGAPWEAVELAERMAG